MASIFEVDYAIEKLISAANLLQLSFENIYLEWKWEREKEREQRNEQTLKLRNGF